VEPDSGSLFGSEKVYVPVRTWPLVVVPLIATLDAEGRPAEAVVKVWSVEVPNTPSEERISK
jgi:DNA/RNA endonuclease G (NUC1)